MKIFTLAALALIATSSLTHADERKNNKAPTANAFPKSIKPQMHAQLMSLIKNESPFDDKRVLKIAVIKEWGAWYRENGVQQQDLHTVVGVFDAQNSKCWLWNEVYFMRQRGDSRVLFSGVQNRVNEIDCALLK